MAEQLGNIPELSDGFDAIGLSQGMQTLSLLSGSLLRSSSSGGQFLRGYVERYNDPPVNNLVTFGSQHMGISDIPVCARYDFLCQAARRVARGAVYSNWAQTNLVQVRFSSSSCSCECADKEFPQAQYFRDPHNYETYLATNNFLVSINNERPDLHNSTFARNLASLNKLVLVLFSEDKTVVPKESAWFGSEAISEDAARQGSSDQALLLGEDKVIIPMRQQPLYLEDWIGLRRLDVRGDVIFEVCEGEHMQIGDCWEHLVRKFAGGRL